MKKILVSLIVLLSTVGPILNIVKAESYQEIQQSYKQKIIEAEAELKIVIKHISRIKKIAPYRIDDLERSRRKELIYWSQKSVAIENSIFRYRKTLKDLKDYIRFSKQ
ncbi:MAG: hypothetical protein HOK67_12030 [Deltaproteobacteria bacterium]|jgi:hypothetical protein|nr:hypothetical protein [Deltaproteobacteria bacterium]MBT6500622.1 hypothetical protein [Deltaproteobacteria bacterium]MBT6610683.1 hypothetical protein [Deltaproteobacteria bacterium]